MTEINKQALLNLMAYPNEISDSELDKLNEVLEAHPYFQLGHSLVAKAKHDKQTHDAHDALTKAAIYAPNRALLRSLFYENLSIEQTFAPSAIHEQTEPSETFESDVPDPNSLDFNHEPTDLEEDLQTEEAFIAEEEPSVHEATTQDSVNDEETEEVYNELEENLRKLRESKNQYSEESEEETDKKKVSEEQTAGDEDSLMKKKNEAEVAPLLKDILSEADEVQPAGSTLQSKQDELINKFIEADDHDWFKPKAETSQHEKETDDLSEDSVVINDDVITENLAEIYIRQGKKEKALEIYHKLIWKFPHKKAYFAEIIQNLKEE